MIRIIAGEFKGHKLKSGLDRPGFRPTKDRVKESLFSILGDISGYNVLTSLPDLEIWDSKLFQEVQSM